MTESSNSSVQEDLPPNPSLCHSGETTALAGTRKKYRGKKYRILGFPVLSISQGWTGDCDAYTRSLLFKGHGVPLWLPRGTSHISPGHLRSGVRIGDVGVINQQGAFKFRFNIFLPPDDPYHSETVPMEFEPISPLQPYEIRSQPNHFLPGTIITSDGIEVIRNGPDLIDLTFKSNAREGGILILHDGASREDLISTERLQEYIQRHAPHWYQSVNVFTTSTEYPNGSLVVVTGCDKTREWANAGFSNAYYDGSVGDVEIKYKRRPDFERPWYGRGFYGGNWYEPITEKGALVDTPVDNPTKSQCVFIRTLRISLSTDCWFRTMPYIPYNSIFTSFIIQKRPFVQRLVDMIAVRLKLVYNEGQAVRIRRGRPETQIFQPNIILAQIILGQYPNAEMCFIEDSCWCALTHGGLGTLTNVLDLVYRVLDTYTIVEKQGYVMLCPKTDRGRPSSSMIQRAKEFFKPTKRPMIPMIYASRQRVSPRYPIDT